MKRKFLFSCILIISMVLSFYMVNTKEKVKAINQEYEYNIPVLMYHFFTTSTSKKGQYTIDKRTLEQDLIYIKDNYTPITLEQLILYRYQDVKLPLNAILITIDDSSLSFYTIMFPLIKQYNVPVVLNVIGKYSDDNNGFHMSWNQIKEVEESPLVELGSHSYDLHSYDNGKYGMKRYKNENDNNYIKRIKEDLKLNNEKLKSLNNITPIAFAYPLGYSNDILKNIIKEKFSISFSCSEKLFNVTSLYDIPRFNRDGRLSTSEMMKKIYHF